MLQRGYRRDLLLYFPFLIPFCCVQHLFGKCSWTYIFYLSSDIDFGKSLGKHGDSTLFIAKQKQQRIGWLITGVRKIFCVQVEVGLNCSTMLAYFVFIETQMIMDTDYGKILIVFFVWLSQWEWIWWWFKNLKKVILRILRWPLLKLVKLKSHCHL